MTSWYLKKERKDFMVEIFFLGAGTLATAAPALPVLAPPHLGFYSLHRRLRRAAHLPPSLFDPALP